MPAEEFTAVWDGFLLTPTSRPYRFELESDDGARLYLGGTLVIDNWGQHYRIVYRKKARPRWLALSYEPRMYNGAHDRYTNLGKINPEIVVFERRASSEPDASR